MSESWIVVDVVCPHCENKTSIEVEEYGFHRTYSQSISAAPFLYVQRCKKCKEQVSFTMEPYTMYRVAVFKREGVFNEPRKLVG